MNDRRHMRADQLPASGQIWSGRESVSMDRSGHQRDEQNGGKLPISAPAGFGSRRSVCGTGRSALSLPTGGSRLRCCGVGLAKLLRVLGGLRQPIASLIALERLRRTRVSTVGLLWAYQRNRARRGDLVEPRRGRTALVPRHASDDPRSRRSGSDGACADRVLVSPVRILLPGIPTHRMELFVLDRRLTVSQRDRFTLTEVESPSSR